MSTSTKIEWTDSTWSPIRFRVRTNAAEIAQERGYASLVSIAGKMAGRVGSHCEHVSPGCEHCYAETNNHRCLPANGTGLPYDRRSRDLIEPFVDEKALLQPLRWGEIKREIPVGGQGAHRYEKQPRRIFVENQSDLFGEWVTDGMLDKIFAVAALCPGHIFQVLTKRPQRMLKYFSSPDLCAFGERIEILDRNSLAIPQGWHMGQDPGTRVRVAGALHLIIPVEEWHRGNVAWPLPNVWLGVSAENQATADERVPPLLRTPAAVRFISAEPLLGGLDLRSWLGPAGSVWQCSGCGLRYAGNVGQCKGYCYDSTGKSCDAVPCPRCRKFHYWCGAVPDGIDWVIVGGESGPGARPLNTEWVKGVADQCRAASVPVFIKQLGAHVIQDGVRHIKKDKKGGDWHEWPHELRIREFPQLRTARCAEASARRADCELQTGAPSVRP